MGRANKYLAVQIWQLAIMNWQFMLTILLCNIVLSYYMFNFAFSLSTHTIIPSGCTKVMAYRSGICLISYHLSKPLSYLTIYIFVKDIKSYLFYVITATYCFEIIFFVQKRKVWLNEDVKNDWNVCFEHDDMMKF